MESSTMTPVGARAVDAQTVAEAFRRTAANHPDVVAVRTADDNVDDGMSGIGDDHGDRAAETGDAAPVPAAGPPPHSRPRWSH